MCNVGQFVPIARCHERKWRGSSLRQCLQLWKNKPVAPAWPLTKAKRTKFCSKPCVHASQKKPANSRLMSSVASHKALILVEETLTFCPHPRSDTIQKARYPPTAIWRRICQNQEVRYEDLSSINEDKKIAQHDSLSKAVSAK